MSEFSTDFSFDLQRFANFKGAAMGDETGVTLSELFDEAGVAQTKKNASSYGGSELMWDKSALVELTPTSANASNSTVGGAIKIVAGTYDTVTTGGTNPGYAITGVTAIDAKGLGPQGSATFKNIGNTTILNPRGTITIGDNTVKFSGGGEKTEDTSTYGDADTPWNVGTVINVKSGKISNVAATAGEVITANSVEADFVNGGTATFDGKSFATVTSFASGGTAQLNVDGGDKIVLQVDETSTSIEDGKAAVTTAFNGQTVKSVTFAGKNAVADVTFGGTAVVGSDISIAGGTVNVDNIKGATSSTITYRLGAEGGDVLDITNAEQVTRSNKTINVSGTGNAKFLVAKDYNADTETSTVYTNLTVGGVTYSFNDEGGPDGNGGVFEVTNGQITGFVFREDGDSITIPKGTNLSNFRLYQAASEGDLAADFDATNESFINVVPLNINLNVDSTTNDYIITQSTEEEIEIEVFDSTTVNIGDASIGFSLPTTKDNRKDAPTSAKIKIGTDGTLKSVEPGNTASGDTAASENSSFDVAGVEITFSGMNNSNVSEDFKVAGVKFATESGDFAYSVGSDSEKEGTASTEAAFKMTNEDDAITAFEKADAEDTSTVTPKVVLAETESEGDEQPDGKLTLFGVEYNYSSPQGKAYLELSATNAGRVDFVFVNEGDTIVIPEENALDLYYQNNYREATETKAPLTAPTTNGESYSITMTKDTNRRSALAEFELFGMAAGDEVTVGEEGSEATFEFSAEGGKFAFSSETVAAGFTAESGTVTMNVAAAALLAQATEDAALFEINDVGVNITAAVDTTTNELVYNQDDKSLAGLIDGSVIVDAGSIAKIYAPSDNPGRFTFGTDDDAKPYDAATLGDFETGTAAFFTLTDGTVTGFTFVDVDDEIAADDFTGIELTDRPTDHTFAAPVVTDGNGEPARARIIKTEEDYDIDGDYDLCYAIEADDLGGKTVLFTDGTQATFTDANTDTQLFFGTDGKLLSILGLSTQGNEVTLTKIDSELGEVLIDGNVVEITGEGFTYRLIEDETPAIVDVLGGTTILQAAGVSYVTTAQGEDGEGTFTFGDNTFTVSGNEDGVTFNLVDEITVTGIDDVDGNESVTGALAGLAINGTGLAIIEATEGTEYTFSGTSFAGLRDGDQVTDAGNVTDFITAEDGNFTVLGTAMAVADDSTAKFSITDGALTAVSELSGTATGDFSGDITVNGETIKVTGDSDSSVAVTGNADESAVTAIADVGGNVALESIGSASQVITNEDGTFNFVEAGQSFGTFTSDGVVFSLTEGKVTAIDGIDQAAEGVSGDFSDGITVDGNLVQVENNGRVAVINGGESSGVGIFGLTDGAVVGAASGIVAAVSVNEGTFTFADGKTFNVAGDSIVEFVLDGEGRVVGINDLDDNAVVTGALDGLYINEATDDPIQIGDGNDNISYSPTDGIGGVVDGNTVTSADGATYVTTDGSGTFTFANGEFVVEDDADGVTFEVTDKNKVVGVSGLDDGAKLSGALSDLTAINGASFSVLGDSSFAVIGASAGISEIQDISANASVVSAGGASKVITDDEQGAFTIGGKSFYINANDTVEFALTDNQVTGINGLSGNAISDNANFEGVTVNGQSFAISGDEGDLSVTGYEGAITAIGNVGGDNVQVQDAGGAQLISTDKAGSFTFTKSGQTFSTTDDLIDFALDDNEKVTDIGLLDEGKDITGNFTDVDTVNEQTVRVTDADNTLTITGKGIGTGIAKISDVDDEAVITDVGGASQVVTSSTGSFSFAGHTNPFRVWGDNSVTFDMDEAEDAKVLGISDLANGTIIGELTDTSVNGTAIDIDGDEDGIVTYAIDGEDKTLGEVGGDDVTITETGDADEIELVKDGTYTIGGKEYDIAAGNAATLGMDGKTVTSIDGIDQDGEQVTGDFTSNIEVGGQNVQVLGDEEITVAREDGELVISGLNNGATIETADDITKAVTADAGEFTDTDNHTLTLGNGGATISLNGAAHFESVIGATEAEISGDLTDMLGVSVISASGSATVRNTNLTYDYANNVLGGVIANDTVLSAGPATLVAADGEDGFYQFGTGTDAQIFALEGDGDGIEFAVSGNSGTIVTAVNGLGEDATLMGELNGLSVNGGAAISITGDSVFSAVGGENDSLKALEGVDGNVTVVSAGGAEEIRTDGAGVFTFDKTGQKFTVAGDSTVTFGINGDESVLSVSDLDGLVAGDFRDEIAVNGNAVQVMGDRDGVIVVGGEDGTVVEAIDDVDAGASVVSSGGATAVRTDGEGVFTFERGDQFTVAGDASVTFALDDGDVTGVYNLEGGNISFNTTSTRAFDINPTVNDELSFSNDQDVTVQVDAEGKIVGVAGLTTTFDENGSLSKVAAIDGLADVTVSGTGPMFVNGNPLYIIDADDSFNVSVNEDGDVEKITNVTGNAIISGVTDGVIEADADGEFNVNGETYAIVDEDNKFGLTTDRDGDLTGVTSLEGSIAIDDGAEELTVNDKYVEVFNVDGDDDDAIPDAVTIAADGTNISVAGMNDGSTINGDLDNASIAVPGNKDGDDTVVVAVNDHTYVIVDDADGVTVNGAGGVVGLDDEAYMLVTAKGTYTVNGEAVSADVGDSIMGADKGAYLYDPDNILVRRNTPIGTIETIVGVPTTVEAQLGTYADPITKDSLQGYFDDATFDWDRPLEIYTTNPDEKSTQTLDFSGDRFTKKVHLFNGPQDLAFNNDGGNVAHVAEYYLAADGTYQNTSGVKNIVLGDGAGDLVVVDQAAGIGNAVSITGGTGDDSIFVRNNVETTFNMSDGGADRIVTFAKANARIALENYDYTTGAGIKFDQHEIRNIASAIKDGTIAFGDGVVSLKTASGSTEVSLNGASGGTESIGGTAVNLFTPEGDRQVVGFTHAAGGVASVDATFTEDVIFIGNNNGKKEGGSTILGGAGNDTAFAGEGDYVDLREGVNVVSLEDDVNRKGAFVNISAGNTVIENTNGTLDEIHGDTLGVDLTQMELEYDGSNLIVKSKAGASVSAYATVVGADKDGTISYDTASDLASSADLAESADGESADSVTSSESTVTASAVASSLVADHNYTNALISSNGTLVKAAIGATGSVIDVKLDEDVRANYYKGDNSGLTFGSYNGDVILDLEGDQFANLIDKQAVIVEGFTSIQAGTEFNYIKGSDENETFFAGRGNSHLYGDGGKNLLVGYEGKDKEGQTTFYVLGHENDAANTIQAFDFVNDDNYTNNNKITADKLEVDLNTNYVNRVELSNNDVLVNVTNRDESATESVIIKGVVDSLTGYGQDILISGDGVVDDVVAQVGSDKLLFDKFANYYNATGKNATVDVDNDKDFAQVWLDGSKGTTFVGDIHDINASTFIGSAELAGNDYNNVIVAGSGETSLWGGHHGDDALYAGEGKDTFYYTLGNGTDTIFGAKDGDVVNLAGVQLSDIVGAEFSGSNDPIQGVALNFRDGGKLYIGDNGGNDVSYVVNGETYVVNEDHNGFTQKA